MQEMIFGIGPNPMCEEWEEEGIECPAFNVYITDKKTWEEKECCNDRVDKEVRDKLFKADFLESQEAIFESKDTSLTKEQIHKMVEDLGFVHNKDFESFMKSAME